MAGRFLLDRSIFKYAEKPYTEFEAWVWLIASASYKGDLRGSLLSGRILLGKTWGWHPDRVRRTLKKWQSEGRVEVSIVSLTEELRTKIAHRGQDHGAAQGSGPWVGTRGIMKITMPNYDTYQDLRKPTPHRGRDQGSVKETAQGSRTLLNTLKKHLKHQEEENTDLSAPPKTGGGLPVENPPAKKKKAEKKETDPRIKTLTQYFEAQHETIIGEKPHIIWGAAGKTFQRLLTTYEDTEDLKRRIDAYLWDPLAWMDTPVHTIAGFEKRVQAYPKNGNQPNPGRRTKKTKTTDINALAARIGAIVEEQDRKDERRKTRDK